MKDYRELEIEFYENKRKMRRLIFTFSILTFKGSSEYSYLKSRNESIKTLFEDNGIKL